MRSEKVLYVLLTIFFGWKSSPGTKYAIKLWWKIGGYEYYNEQRLKPSLELNSSAPNKIYDVNIIKFSQYLWLQDAQISDVIMQFMKYAWYTNTNSIQRLNEKCEERMTQDRRQDDAACTKNVCHDKKHSCGLNVLEKF